MKKINNITGERIKIVIPIWKGGDDFYFVKKSDKNETITPFLCQEE